MIQVKIIQANNELSLDTNVNVELQELQNQDCIIKDIQFQHTAIILGEGMRPSFAAMITYEDNNNIEQGYIADEEDELNVPIQRD